MKIFLRSYDVKDKENPVLKEREVSSLIEATGEQKANEKIHVCYHDEKNPKPCKLI